MLIKRRQSRIVTIGKLNIGGGQPVAIQSMTKTLTADIKATVAQILRLEAVGCELVRVAVPDINSARSIKEIKKHIHIPVVADIHFNYKLALEAIKSGADKIRLNPGNIDGPRAVREIVTQAKERNIAIRIGTNVGSVKRNKKNMADSLVSGVIAHLRILERHKFYNTVISVKASDVLTTIWAYRKIAKICDYPLHLGLTAAGWSIPGIVKSSLGIGVLLTEGIGNTIRVSLTTEPEEEVIVAKEILSALNLRRFGIEIISCPTCGRCNVDLVKILKDLEKKISLSTVPAYRQGRHSPQSTDKDYRPLTMNRGLCLKVAVMGCVVNGPGEAKDADFGIACGRGCGIIFKKGQMIKKASEVKLVKELIREIRKNHLNNALV